MHLTYTGGGKYANAAKSYREGGKVMKTYIHLGKVMDKEKGIFDHKDLGLVRFDLDKGEFVKADIADAPRPLTEEKLILDFGDAYFLDWYVRRKGFMDCIEGLDMPELDTLRSLIVYYIVSGEAVGHALDWYTGSYSSILYPKANMDGRRISEYFEALGDESNYRAFFSRYIPLVTEGSDRVNVIIDSTGLPNDVHMPISALSNHNGDINNEVRLIIVMDRDREMPVFARYVPGNIVDSTTLIRTMRELEQQGVKCDYALMDAGYPTETNIRDLFESKISFMSRLESGSVLYKGLRKEVLPGIMVRENFTMFGERRLDVKRVECDLATGCPGYAYCILDVDRKNMEDARLAKKAVKNGLTDGEIFDSMSDTGFFVVISDMKLENPEVLPDYYIRQNVEQFMDIGKGSASLLPLRVHSEDTFRGHLLVSFIAAAVVQSLQNELVEIGKVKKQGPEKRIGNKSPNLVSALMDLRNQKCKVYDEVVLPKEPQAKANALYSLFKLEVPYAIPKM
ncbi:MAG: transposase [archaeon]|nr:transposase [archaeon]